MYEEIPLAINLLLFHCQHTSSNRHIRQKLIVNMQVEVLMIKVKTDEAYARMAPLPLKSPMPIIHLYRNVTPLT